jgi:hypothetical protein
MFCCDAIREQVPKEKNIITTAYCKNLRRQFKAETTITQAIAAQVSTLRPIPQHMVINTSKWRFVQLSIVTTTCCNGYPWNQ